MVVVTGLLNVDCIKGLLVNTRIVALVVLNGGRVVLRVELVVERVMIGFVVVGRVVVARFDVVLNFVVLVYAGFVVFTMLYIWILTESFN